MRLSFDVPMRTQQSANSRVHWRVRSNRRNAERTAVALLFPKKDIRPLLVVTMTRVSPGEMDDDNLAGALKGIRDEIAKQLRIDDGSPLVKWEPKQERGKRGEHYVRVEIAVRGPVESRCIACGDPSCPGGKTDD
jgi:hypothetical protein